MIQQVGRIAVQQQIAGIVTERHVCRVHACPYGLCGRAMGWRLVALVRVDVVAQLLSLAHGPDGVVSVDGDAVGQRQVGGHDGYWGLRKVGSCGGPGAGQPGLGAGRRPTWGRKGSNGGTGVGGHADVAGVQ